MKKQIVKVFTVVAAILFLSVTVFELSAEARAGGSRSSGSRGSRSYSAPASSAPARSAPAQSQPRPQAAAPASPMQQPMGGSFMRSMAGGIVGGMLGGMLFRGLAGAGGGMGGMGGSGIGIFEIILLAGGGYLLYRYIKKKREESALAVAGPAEYQGGNAIPVSNTYLNDAQAPDDLDIGLSHIRQMDPDFDENRFNDLAMDHFFKIQGAWMNRDLVPVSGILTDEMKRVFQGDLDQLLRVKQINRLENIAVRKVDVVEVWQESGQDYITASIYANLLDYTTDETTGAVVSGSQTEPVKFEEYWTFTRPVGNNPWRLSDIRQK